MKCWAYFDAQVKIVLKYLLSQTQPAEIPQKCELIPRQAELLGETDRKKMRVENVERTQTVFLSPRSRRGGLEDLSYVMIKFT